MVDLEARSTTSSSGSGDIQRKGNDLVTSLEEKLGLSRSGLTLPLVSQIQGKMARQFNSTSGIIDFATLFGPLQVLRKETAMPLPTKLEIGAGAGEWAVAQASADVGRANWLALELRCDRAYQIFCRQLYSCSNHKSNNLAVVAGDAYRVLGNHIASNSTQAIFINHPEPPERSMVVDKRGHDRPQIGDKREKNKEKGGEIVPPSEIESAREAHANA